METIYQITDNVWGKFTKWMKTEKNQCRFVVCCFCISLIPLLILSFYNHPAMDDFNYGVLTRHAWISHKGLGRIIPVLQAAVERAVYLWHAWQGTYSFSVIAALRPSVITEKLTFIQTFILLGLFVGGISYFVKVLLQRLLGVSREVALIVACVVMTLCIQYVPYGVEAFYWWNGSIGYTGLFSVMLILFAALFYRMRQKRISFKGMLWLIILEVLLGGGMFPMALLTAVVLCLLFLDVLLGKNYPKKLKIQFGVLLLVYIPALVLNLIAPGNQRRQAYFQHRTPFEAIYKSYTKSLAYLLESTNVVIILVMIGLFAYMFWKLKETKFEFHCPFMFSLVTYSMYVVLWVPGIYAVRYISGGRYFNILYYGIIVFYASNVIYYAGWLRRQYEKCGEEVMGILQKSVPFILGCMAAVCVAIGFWNIDIVTDLEEITSATALKSLVYGEARVYHEEIKEREALYNDPDVKRVVVEEVTYRPELLYYGTLTTDPEDSRNQAMCNYYDKEYMVKLEPEDSEENAEEGSGETSEETEGEKEE